jgi:hypothetical protein
MDKDYLTLKRASASRSSGEWGEDDYDVLAESVVVGRIFKAAASPVGTPWLWMLAHCEVQAGPARLAWMSPHRKSCEQKILRPRSRR